MDSNDNFEVVVRWGWEDISFSNFTIGDELIQYDPRYSFDENMERDWRSKYRKKLVEKYGFK